MNTWKKLMSGFLSLAAALNATCTVSSAASQSPDTDMPAQESPDEAQKEQIFDSLRTGLAGIERIQLTEEEGQRIRARVRNDYAAAGITIDENGITEETEINATDPPLSGYSFSNHYYSSFLSANELTLYSRLNTSALNFIKSNVTLSGEVGSNGKTYYYFTDSIYYSDLGISDEKAAAIWYIFFLENPQYYFLQSSYSAGWQSNGYETKKYLVLCAVQDFASYTARNTYSSQINTLTSAWITQAKSISDPLEREIYLAKTLANHTSYHYDAYGNPVDEGKNQTMAGALVDKTCVCNGYSLTMEYLLNASGIESMVVVSSNHAWNSVKLYGNYYEADITNADREIADYLDMSYMNKSHSYFVNTKGSSWVYDPLEYPGELSYPPAATKDTVEKTSQGGSFTVDSIPSQTYTGSAVRPAVTVKNGSTVLVSGVDYTVTYSDNVNCGTATVKITGIGSYSGITQTVYFSITGRSASSFTISPVPAQTYTGSAIKPVLTVYDGSKELKLNTDYTVSYANNINIGTAVVTVTGKGNYTGSVTTTFSITAGAAAPVLTAKAGDRSVTLSWNQITGATNYAVYENTSSGSSIIAYTTGTTYEVTGLTNGNSYSFCVKAGVSGTWSAASNNVSVVPKVVISAPGSVKATPGEESVTVSWGAVSGAVKYALTMMNGSAKTVVSSKITALSYTVNGLTAGKQYSFYVQAYNGSEWSADSLTVSAEPLAASVAAPKITGKAGNGQATLSWNAVPGAEKYSVARVNGSYIDGPMYAFGTTYTYTGLTNGVTYKFVVLAYAGGKWSEWSNVVTITPSVESMGPDITAVAGDGCVMLSWNAMPGAKKYAVKIFDGYTETLLSNSITATSYTASGLTNGQTYSFRALYYNGSAWSEPGFHTMATPQKVFASPDLTLKPGDGRVDVSWEAVPGAQLYSIGYICDDSITIISDSIKTTSLAVTGLTNGKEYHFFSLAYNGTEWSPRSDTFLAVPNGEIKGPTLTASAGEGYVTLTWQAVAGAVKYAITMTDGSTTTVLSNKITSTSYKAAGLTAGKTYYFCAQAYNGSKWSSKGPQVSAVPGAVFTGPKLTASAGEGYVDLSWQAVAGAVKYAIIMTDGGTSKVLSNKITSTSYKATGLTAGKTYYFCAQAYNGSKWSSKGTQVSAVPKAVFTGPTLTASAGEGCVDLSWQAVVGAVKYAIIMTDGGTSKVLSNKITSTSYKATGLAAGKTYYFCAQAYNGSKWSSKGPQVSAAPKAVFTGPKLSVTIGDGCVELKWQAVAGAVKYAITMTDGGTPTVLSNKITSTSYKVTGLTDGKTYYFCAQVYNGSKWSSKGQQISAVPGTPVAVPTVTVTEYVNSIILSWNAVPGAVKYRVTEESLGTTVISDSVTGTSYQVTGLERNKTYYFSVQTFNGLKWSEKSAPEQASLL